MQSAETVCYIALGGNVGNVSETFRRALEQLRQSGGVRIERCSSLYQTSPVGPRCCDSSGSISRPYLNAAVQLRTTLQPRGLLKLLVDIEARLGRSRSGPWQPRPIDLDMILYGDRVIETSELVVPHPACWYRRFVLDPLTEIAADVVHPVKQQSLSDLRERLLRRPFRCALLSEDQGWAEELAKRLAAEFPEVQFEVAGPSAAPPDAELVVEWARRGLAIDGPTPLRSHPGRLSFRGEPEAALEHIRIVLQSALGKCVRVSQHACELRSGEPVPGWADEKGQSGRKRGQRF